MVIRGSKAKQRSKPARAATGVRKSVARQGKRPDVKGMALAITRVETLEVPVLPAWYVGLLPPRVVGVEDRIARGHEAPRSDEKCSAVVSQTVRSGLEQGEIGWRDLVDFYARHRCATYRFPPSYRAFRSDGERPVPDTTAGM